MICRERRAAPAEGCSTKVPALAPVQSAEPSPAEPLTKVLSCFSTELSTVVLKTFGPRFSKQLLKKKSRPQGRLSGKSSTAQLARHFLQQLLVNIEVGVNVLHVILVFERFHEPNHSVGRLTFQLNVVLRNHRYAGGSRLDSSFLHGFEDGFECRGCGQDLPILA